MQGIARGAIRSGGDSGRGRTLRARRRRRRRWRCSPASWQGGIGRDGAPSSFPTFRPSTARPVSDRVTWPGASTRDRPSAEADVIVRDPVVLTATLAPVPRCRRPRSRPCSWRSTTSRGRPATTRLDARPLQARLARPGADKPYAGAIRAWRPAPRASSRSRRDRRRPGHRPRPRDSPAPGLAGGPNRGLCAETFRHSASRPAPEPCLSPRRCARLANRGPLCTLSSDLLADVLPGTGSVSLSASAISPFGGIDVPALLQALDRYPGTAARSRW